MKETNVVLYDLTGIFSENKPEAVLMTATDDITHCIVYEYLRVFHSFLDDIVDKSLSHGSQCQLVLERVAIQYGVYTSNTPALELRRRSPHIHRALNEYLGGIIKAVRQYMFDYVPVHFKEEGYTHFITHVRTKTWGDKNFLMYTKDVESLTWPSKL